MLLFTPGRHKEPICHADVAITAPPTHAMLARHAVTYACSRRRYAITLLLPCHATLPALRLRFSMLTPALSLAAADAFAAIRARCFHMPPFRYAIFDVMPRYAIAFIAIAADDIRDTLYSATMPPP